jgi:hypothetical protein
VGVPERLLVHDLDKHVLDKHVLDKHVLDKDVLDKHVLDKGVGECWSSSRRCLRGPLPSMG